MVVACWVAACDALLLCFDGYDCWVGFGFGVGFGVWLILLCLWWVLADGGFWICFWVWVCLG